jgi:hypothetical protein
MGEAGWINLYSYVANSPISKIDPLGLFGGVADANPGGVNGVPYMSITYNPMNGISNVINNDDPAQVLLAGIAPLIGGTGLAAGAGLVEAYPTALYYYALHPQFYQAIAITTIYTLAGSEEPPSVPDQITWEDSLSQVYGILLELLQDQDNSPGYFQPALGVWECVDSTGDYMKTQVGSPGPNWTLVEIE